MNLRKALFISLALLVPSTAFADFDDNGDIPEDLPGDNDAPAIWNKTYTKAQYWGLNGDWGAGYAIYGKAWAQPAWETIKDKVGIRASAEGYTKLNGKRYRLFYAVASGSTEAKKKTTASLNVYIGGRNVYSPDWESTTSTQIPMLDQDFSTVEPFFDERVGVGVGPLSMSFRAKVTGSLSATVNGKLSYTGVEATTNPKASLSLYASAAVGDLYCAAGLGCVGAQAGVYGDVDLISASVPATAAAWWSRTPTGGALLTYKAKASATITSLDGEIGVWAKACLGGCVGGDKTLFDWNGLTSNFTIANHSGTYCIAGNCGTP